MKDHFVTGNSVMIKIDGKKIKELRERQGLTQLYLATAVQVTTDTISRWENKRYPSIKKENGLKLAEALEVQLKDILEQESEIKDEPFPSTKPPQPTSRYKFIIPPVLVALILALVSGYFFLTKVNTPRILAHRIMPARTIAALPFPVVVTIDGQTDYGIALILKETLPANASIIATSPEVALNTGKDSNIKWIQKINEKMAFAYMVKIDANHNTISSFSGSIAISQGAGEPIMVEGDSKILLGPHHWADTDGNNIISDREILTVYDQYSGIDGFEIDIDLIERMWLGSGYLWNQNSKSFTILP